MDPFSSKNVPQAVPEWDCDYADVTSIHVLVDDTCLSEASITVNIFLNILTYNTLYVEGGGGKSDIHFLYILNIHIASLSR